MISSEAAKVVSGQQKPVIYIVIPNPVAFFILRRKFKDSMDAKYHPLSSIPKDDAPASEVREFFSQTLINGYNVALSDAETIASQWRYGGGTELAYFDVEAFRSIFGGEVGTILYEKSRTMPSAHLKPDEETTTFAGFRPIGKALNSSLKRQIPSNSAYAEFLVFMLLGGSFLSGFAALLITASGNTQLAATSWIGAGLCFSASVFVFVIYHIAIII